MCRTIVKSVDDPWCDLNSYSAVAASAALAGSESAAAAAAAALEVAGYREKDETLAGLMDLIIPTTENVIKAVQQVCTIPVPGPLCRCLCSANDLLSPATFGESISSCKRGTLHSSRKLPFKLERPNSSVKTS